MIDEKRVIDLANSSRLALNQSEISNCVKYLNELLISLASLPQVSQNDSDQFSEYNIIREDFPQEISLVDREFLRNSFSKRVDNFLAVKRIFDDQGSN